MTTLTLYTKPGCSLCESAADALERVRARAPFTLDIIDVGGDRDLLARYGQRVPVVLLDGEPIFEYFVDEDALEHMLTQGAAT